MPPRQARWTTSYARPSRPTPASSGRSSRSPGSRRPRTPAPGMRSPARSGYGSAVLEEAVGDPLVARMVMLIGDGMYYNTALLPATNTVLRDETDVDELIALVRRIARTEPPERWLSPAHSSPRRGAARATARPVVRRCTDRPPERRRRLGRSPVQPQQLGARGVRLGGERLAEEVGIGVEPGERDLRTGVGAVAEGDQSAEPGRRARPLRAPARRRGGRSRASRWPPRSARSRAARRSPPGARTARRRAHAVSARSPAAPPPRSTRLSQRDRSASRSVANSSPAVRRVACRASVSSSSARRPALSVSGVVR